MEYYKQRLCFEARWLIDSGIIKEADYINMTKDTENAKLTVLRRGCRNTRALVEYDSMPEDMKQSIIKTLGGNPYDQAKQSILENYIQENNAASDYYDTYKLADGRFLPLDAQIEYYNNVKILDAIHLFLTSTMTKRRAMGGKASNKWGFISEAVNSLNRIKYKHTLPKNARALQRKYNEYKGAENGFKSLIHSNYLKQANSAKVKDKYQVSLLTELFGDARNFDNAQIMRIYNEFGRNQSPQWEAICLQTVSSWRKKLNFITHPGRRGTSDFYNTKLMHVLRSAPTKPLYFLTIDGWQAELLYKKTEVKKYKKDGQDRETNVTTYHNRLTVVILLDPFNKYPLGYAIGERENPDLIKAALRNAMKHTAELFGGMYRAHQLQSDKYGRGSLTPFYEAIGKHYTPTSKNYSNPKAKVIEPYFNTINRTYCQMQLNWSGFGITSNKDKQPNGEFLNKFHAHFPDKQGCAQQIASIVNMEREKKRAQYLAAWEQMPAEDKLPLTYEAYLRTFGVKHEYTNVMQPRGLFVTLGGIKRVYDTFDLQFRQYPHIQWNVLYDPEDTQQILVQNNDESLRFLLKQKEVIPMALEDFQPGHGKALHEITKFNKDAVNLVIDKRAEAGDAVREMLENNPLLQDTARKLGLTDSTGNNKDWIYTLDMPPVDASQPGQATQGKKGGLSEQILNR